MMIPNRKRKEYFIEAVRFSFVPNENASVNASEMANWKRKIEESKKSIYGPTNNKRRENYRRKTIRAGASKNETNLKQSNTNTKQW